MSNAPRYYDMDGHQINGHQADELLGDRDARVVAYTELPDDRAVSTVLLVVDHSLQRDGPPLIFETMLFPDCAVCVRTPNRHAALAAHDQVVAEAKKGRPPVR